MTTRDYWLLAGMLLVIIGCILLYHFLTTCHACHA